MSKELQTTNLDNLPEDIRNEILKDGREYSRQRTDVPPSIGISLEDDTIGQFQLEEYEDREKKITLLGKEIEIVILKEKRSFSYYNDVSKQLELFTNELNVSNGSISAFEPVALKDNNNNIVWQGRYEDFMKERKVNWLKAKRDGQEYQSSMLKQKVILYAYIISEKKMVKIFVNMSSTIGIDPKGGYLFKNPAEGSLEKLKEQKKSIAPYVYSVKLTNIKGEGDKIVWRKWLFNFGRDLNTEEITKMFEMKKEVEDYCDVLNSFFGINKRLMTAEDVEGNPFNRISAPTSDDLPSIDVDADMDLPTSEEEIRIEDIPF
ncbi:MAG: hypothetical protein WC175_03510 [Candidatus Dojkabacteria bacterium]